MKRIAFVVAAASIITGCGPAPVQIHRKPSYVTDTANAKASLEWAKRSSSVKCESETKCKRAFLAAKNYVIDNSDMRIQTSDEHYIATYRPSYTNGGMIGMSARLVPVSGGGYEIRPNGECSIDIPECLETLTARIKGFKPYVESIITE